MRSNTTRYAVGAGLAGLISLGGVGLANAASDTAVDETTPTLTAVDDSTATDVSDTSDATVDDSTTSPEAGQPREGCDEADVASDTATTATDGS